MKLSFSTLGCQEWDLQKIIGAAQKYGYQGVELRGYMGNLDVWTAPEFSTGIATTRAMFKDSGLKVPCLGSGAKMFSPKEDRAGNLEEVKRYAEVAYGLGAPYIRVFGGAVAGETLENAFVVAAEFIEEAARIARASGAEILVETHDDWADSSLMIEAFKAANFPRGASILWDVHHTYRPVGEDPDLTWKTLGPLVKHTHWKDSRVVDKPGAGGIVETRTQYCLVGDGDIPLRRILEILLDSGCDGWMSLEWERKWHPELETPEVAFPQFVKYMKNLVAKVDR